MRLTLLGVDPGIRDTGAVGITLDFENKTVDVTSRVWSGVVDRHGFNVTTDEQFLTELTAFKKSFRDTSMVLSAVEGYRQRGLNVQQDREMLDLIKDIRAALPNGVIVDNTGIKKVVTEDMLKLFYVSRFKRGTNHADLKSAARVALKRGIDGGASNHLMSDYVKDNLFGSKEDEWSLGLSVTL